MFKRGNGYEAIKKQWVEVGVISQAEADKFKKRIFDRIIEKTDEILNKEKI